MQISDEEQRSGMFTRIFPTKEAASYMPLFENQRYNNIFAMAYVCSGARGTSLFSIVNSAPQYLSIL